MHSVLGLVLSESKWMQTSLRNEYDFQILCFGSGGENPHLFLLLLVIYVVKIVRKNILSSFSLYNF